MKAHRTRSVQWFVMAMLGVCLAPWLVGCGNQAADADGTIDPAPPSVTVSAPVTVTATGSLTDIISKSAHLSLLNAAITRAGLTENLRTGSLTMFAPTDDAFRSAGFATKAALDSLPVATVQRLLQYHLLNSRLSASTLPVNAPTNTPTALATTTVSLFKTTDGQLFANAARVVQPDIGANNSVMFVIDRLMSVPTLTTVELIRANPDLSMLGLALDRVGSSVTSTLLSPTDRGVTVFAPTNAAFRAAGFSDEDAIRSADVNRLGEILKYHVVNSRSFSPTLRTGELTTLQGTAFTVNVDANGATLTGKGNSTASGKLLRADLVSTNGVLHVIDRVLLPAVAGQ